MRRNADHGRSESLEDGWSFSPADPSGDSQRSAKRSAEGDPGKTMRIRLRNGYATVPKKQSTISFGKQAAPPPTPVHAPPAAPPTPVRAPQTTAPPTP
eukprot:7318985-Prymnesium_polylepis.1